jgi:5-methylcytosine-specific restriction protein A
VRQFHTRFQTGECRYDGARWRRLRQQFITQHPLCIQKDTDTRCTLVAEEVDHIVPHRGDPALFFDWDNLQAMCKVCHSRKTASETGWHV